MSKEHPFILFAGNLELGQALSPMAEARGWFVMMAEDDLEALAMYTVYSPDVVVIEQHTQFVDEVEFHLRSVGAELVLIPHPVALVDIDFNVMLDTIAARLGHVPPERESRRLWTIGTVST